MSSFPHHHHPDDVVDIMRGGFWRSVPVALVNDPKLSDSALGIATWLCTRPEGFVFVVGVICRRFGMEPGGRKWVRVRSELEAGGYWMSEQIHGKWSHRFDPLGRFHKPPLQNAGVQNAALQNEPIRIDGSEEQKELKEPPPRERERAEPHEGGGDGGDDENRHETQKQMTDLLDAACWGEEQAGRPPGSGFRPWKRRKLLAGGATTDDWDLLAAHHAHLASKPCQQDREHHERVREINLVLASLNSVLTDEAREFELKRLRQLAPNHPRLHDQRTGKKTAASAGRPS